MQISLRIGHGFGHGCGLALLALTMPLLRAQPENPPASAGSALLPPAAANPVATADPVAGSVMRTIDDPNTGLRWILLRDESHPGGPGRLVPAGDATATLREIADSTEHLPEHPSTPGKSVESTSAESLASRPKPVALVMSIKHEPVQPPVRPMIRAGDHVRVEEHSAVVDARLEAVALGSASAGSVFNVRLAIGGKVMRAIADGPGRATLAPEMEGQP
jgi:hypothetical protein